MLFEVQELLLKESMKSIKQNEDFSSFSNYCNIFRYIYYVVCIEGNS